VSHYIASVHLVEYLPTHRTRRTNKA